MTALNCGRGGHEFWWTHYAKDFFIFSFYLNQNLNKVLTLQLVDRSLKCFLICRFPLFSFPFCLSLVLVIRRLISCFFGDFYRWSFVAFRDSCRAFCIFVVLVPGAQYLNLLVH